MLRLSRAATRFSFLNANPFITCEVPVEILVKGCGEYSIIIINFSSHFKDRAALFATLGTGRAQALGGQLACLQCARYLQTRVMEGDLGKVCDAMRSLSTRAVEFAKGIHSMTNSRWESASMQEDPTQIRYDIPTKVSWFVELLHNFPRFGFGNRLDSSGEYADSILVAIIPWLLAALLCLLASIFARKRPVRGPSYGTVRIGEDGELESAPTRGAVARAAALFHVACGTLALTLAANFHLHAGAATTLAVARDSADELTNEARTVFAIAETFLQRLNDQLGKHALLKGAISLAGQFDPAHELQVVKRSRAQLEEVASTVRDLEAEVAAASNVAFVAVVATVALLALAVAALFAARKGLAVPLSAALAWVCVAGAAAVALLAADGCATLVEFHKIVLVQAGTQPRSILHGADTSKNLLIRSGVQCPHEMAPELHLRRLAGVFEMLLDNPFTDYMLAYLYPGSTKEEQWKLRKWMAPAIRDAVNCKLVVTHAGRINHALCTRHGPVLGLAAAWAALVALALLLTAVALGKNVTSHTPWGAFLPRLTHDDDR